MARYIKKEIVDLQGSGSTKAYYKLKTWHKMDFDDFVERCNAHNGAFSKALLKGVMTAVCEELAYQVSNGYSVKIDGLGIFFTTIENEKGGAISEEKFSVNTNLKALHIRFLPEQEQEMNISSREFFKKAEFINIDTLKGGSSSAGSGSGSGSGTENGGNSSGGSGIVPGPSGDDQPSGN